MVKLEDAGISRNHPISFLMNKKVVLCKERETIENVCRKILKTGHRRIPIVNNKKRLTGILTITDILDVILRGEDVKNSVSNIMIREVLFCEENERIGFVIKKLKISRKGGMPIVDSKRKVRGIVSERDFVWNFDSINFGVRVKDVMSSKPIHIQSSYSIMDCLRTIVNSKFRRLPVLDGTDLIGIVTSVDILRFLFENKFDLETLDDDLSLVYKEDVFKINGEKDLSEAIRLMKEKDVGGLIVASENILKGIITERDILEEIE